MNTIPEDHIPNAILTILDTNFQEEHLSKEINALAHYSAGTTPDEYVYTNHR